MRTPNTHSWCAHRMCVALKAERIWLVTVPNIFVWHFVIFYFYDPKRNYRASHISATFSKSVLRNKKKLIGILFKFTCIELVRMQPPTAVESLVSRCTWASRMCAFSHMKYETAHASVLMECQMSKIVHQTLFSHERAQHPIEINAKQTKRMIYKMVFEDSAAVQQLHLMTRKCTSLAFTNSSFAFCVQCSWAAAVWFCHLGILISFLTIRWRQKYSAFLALN